MTRKIAITGNIGCGKSWVSALFESEGIPVFYSDAEAKKLYQRPEVMEAMIRRFGDDIYLSDGHINKVSLSQIIFNDAEARTFVEQTLYPALNRYFDEWASEQDASFVLYESALIFEKHLESMFDAVIVVSASEGTRLRRVMLRDHCSEEAVRARMANQWSEAEKIARADYVIYHENDDEDGFLFEQVKSVIAAIASLSQND